MTSFRFRLQKVLEWRRAQLELEEAQFQQQAAALSALDRAAAEAEAEGLRAEVQVRSWDRLQGRDLASLDCFRKRMQARRRQIAIQRADCARLLEIRKNTMLEARRRLRLLERLKERRLAEWESARDREIEETASESFLARWTPAR